MATTVAVIVAGGRGGRLQGPSDIPKQYLPLGGAPVLAHSLRVLANHPQIDRTQVVINPSDRDRYEAAAG
ncbi:MAG: IspD/TarI family cytidylyltransferase, partial [Hyphomicrobium sp.]